MDNRYCVLIITDGFYEDIVEKKEPVLNENGATYSNIFFLVVGMLSVSFPSKLYIFGVPSFPASFHFISDLYYTLYVAPSINCSISGHDTRRRHIVKNGTLYPGNLKTGQTTLVWIEIKSL